MSQRRCVDCSRRREEAGPPVEDFQDIAGRKLPTRALPYADFELVPSSVSFNVRLTQ